MDLPLPWTILDKGTSGTPLRAAYTTDPKTGTDIELDTNYLGAETAYTNLRVNSSSIATAHLRNGDYNHLYRDTYIAWIFSAKDSSNNYYIKDTTAAPIPFDNGLPNRTRIQAVKEAAIKTWLKYQDRVLWAMRGLEDTTYPAKSTNPVSPIPTVTNNSTTGGNREWILLNDDPLGGARYIAKLVASTSTPLTHALADTYFQLQNDNPFAKVHKKISDTDDQRPVDCLKHFVILFTDGNPNIGSDLNAGNEDWQPYSSGPTAGNAAVAGSIGSLERFGTLWNVPTLAGVAAHGGNKEIGWIRDPSTQSGTTITGLAPFWIPSRVDNTGVRTTFSTPHAIQTMTVGVSLGENFQADGITPIPIAADKTSPKYRLLAAATYGDPSKSKTGYDISTAKEFAVDGIGEPLTDSVYYFDGRDPDTLVDNLDKAFKLINNINAQGITSTPVVPFSGLALSRQIYLGNFEAPDKSDPNTLWSGDLLMFPTRVTSGKTEILTNTGGVVAALSPATASAQAQWSAKQILNSTPWSSRIVYTRPSATAGNPNPALVEFTSDAGALKFDGFKGELPAGTDAQRQALVNWMRGGDNKADAAVPLPYGNRSNLMGDIINSAPTVIEYASSAGFPSAVGAPGDAVFHYRLVIVGTNSGFLHAFAETSWDEEITVGPEKFKITKGVAKEMWSFIPTDFLKYLSYLTVKTNPHRFLVDGAPVVYHRDLPTTSSSVAGNGKVDNGEKAFLVFGLRKGGRSYYALDISNPSAPTAAWALRADEATTIPSTRVLAPTTALADAQKIVGDMGYSTSQPAIGRVLFTSNGARKVRPAVFLGGGLSDPEVETLNFSGRKMGRSAIALDVTSGEILQVWDLSAKAGVGSISAGVVPFEFFPSSGFVQRGYFTDNAGGVWALGSDKHSSGDYSKFRLDSSDLDNWTVDGTRTGAPSIRKVYQATNDKHSTLPAPFNIGQLPVFRDTDPKVAPATVGLAFTSGDRNNPLDLYLKDPKPTRHRINIVFDRQDSQGLGIDVTGMTDGNLEDMSASTDPTADVINPSKPGYYLRNKYGYYINFPSPITVGTSTFYSKGINEPTVLAGVLFYSYFKPTSGDACSPGTGLTRSWRVCDVINPVVNTGEAALSSKSCTAGFVMEWAGVASNFGARGTVAVNQAGGVLAAGGGGDSGTGASDMGKVAIGTATGSYSESFPKPRVWRSVHSNQ
ncbi:MAG: hypothetical protein HYZ13_10310 [Acidobacteria bacterium]|nr:hypothetical protein [Acidobacteriota bacterium]